MIKKISFKEYREIERLNISSLVEIEKSPAHFQHFIKNPKKDTYDLMIGRLTHCMILTPDEVKNDYFVMPKLDKRKKEDKALFEDLSNANKDKECVNEEDFLECQNIANSVLSSPKIKKLLESGLSEKTILWELDGIKMKSRLDFESNVIIDIKTCQDAREEQFAKDCVKYKYAEKLFSYQEASFVESGIRKPVIIIAVEKSAPYAWKVYHLGDFWMEYGRNKFFKMIEKYKKCVSENKWDSYGHEVCELQIPSWVITRESIE